MKLPVQYLLGAAAIVIILAGMKIAAGILNPILLGLLLAMCILPLANWITKLGLHKSLAIVISLLTIVVGAIAISLLVSISVSQFIAELPVYQEKITIMAKNLQTSLAEAGIDISNLINVSDVNPEKIANLAGKLVSGLGNVMSSTFVIILIIVFTVIEMINYKVGVKKGNVDQVTIIDWFDTAGADIRNYVSLTALIGLFTAILNYFLLLALGVDFALLWALLSFLMNFIPNIGFILSFIPPALIALLNYGWGKAFGVFIGFFLINALMENVVRPMIFRKTLNISILVTFLSMIFWGFILGLMGTILAVPLTLLIMRLIKKDANNE